jgi:hypothetical protein
MVDMRRVDVWGGGNVVLVAFPEALFMNRTGTTRREAWPGDTQYQFTRQPT